MSSSSICQVCGARAVVHISDVVEGELEFRHFCDHCADSDAPHRQPRRRRAGLAALLIAVGVFVLAISAFADWLQFGKATGFGWQQKTAALVAAAVALLGAIARAPTLLVIGLVTVAIAVLADWLQFGGHRGFGNQQIAGCIIGIVTTAFGIAVALRR